MNGAPKMVSGPPAKHRMNFRNTLDSTERLPSVRPGLTSGLSV